MKKKSYQAAEETLIKCLINKYEKSDTHEVRIGTQDLPNIDLSEQEITRTLLVLEKDGMFDILRRSQHNKFDMSWLLALKPRCVH